MFDVLNVQVDAQANAIIWRRHVNCQTSGGLKKQNRPADGIASAGHPLR